MAKVALDIVSERGPLHVSELADALVAAGATRARSPLQAAESAVRRDDRFILGLDGRIWSAWRQLEGAFLSHRLNAFEVMHDLLVLEDADWLTRIVTAGGGRLASGESIIATHLFHLFEIPWDEDGYGHDGLSLATAPTDLVDGTTTQDEIWGYLVRHQWSDVLHGPPGWLGNAQAGDLVAIGRQGDSLERMVIRPPEPAADRVAAAIETLRQLAARLRTGSDTEVGHAPDIRQLLTLVATEGREMLAMPLPPMGELISEAFPAKVDPGEVRKRLKLVALDSGPQTTLDDHYTDHMAIKMTATDVKGHLLALLDRVAAGEEIEITKHGRSVARLVPSIGPHALRGSLAGVAMTADPGDDLLSPEEDWYVA